MIKQSIITGLPLRKWSKSNSSLNYDITKQNFADLLINSWPKIKFVDIDLLDKNVSRSIIYADQNITMSVYEPNIYWFSMVNITKRHALLCFTSKYIVKDPSAKDTLDLGTITT